MNLNIVDIIAVIISAIISSMGLGGGGVLILYLTLFKDTNQLLAQGLNLLFFLPCSITSLIIYSKRKVIKFKVILPVIIGGIAGVLIGMPLISNIDPKYLKIAFAVFLIIMGIYSVFSSKKENKKESQSDSK